ncbi:MAG: Fructose import binding protein FrcB [Candidatus Celerinatantimonas neptuna]|nr:MAG: Fructose import binding protein FrcB [Candidatus Celerinatantimonas neptuna]
MKRLKRLIISVSCLVLSCHVFAAEKPVIGLITKTDTNPFFVKMKEGAQMKADELGLKLQTYAGQFDGDTKSQQQAIENLVASDAKGILITPSDPAAIAPYVEMARSAGVLVIALDTPITKADATFATDNFKAGELIGEWAKARMGAKASQAKIALLDLNKSHISVDVARDQGFLKGFGIDVKNPKKIGDENDPRIVGNEVTQGSVDGGRKAIETLLQKNTGINLVYTINEPAAEGAYETLDAFGADNVLIVSVDGGCAGVENVKKGIIGATAMQFPLRMASMGVEAINEYIKTGKKPQNTKGLDFLNTGVELITDKPVAGVPSKSSAEGLKMCW